MSINDKAAQELHDFLVKLFSAYNELSAEVQSETVQIKLGDNYREVTIEDIFQAVGQAVTDKEFQLDVIDSECWRLDAELNGVREKVDFLENGVDHY